jgi:hypothetical protein
MPLISTNPIIVDGIEYPYYLVNLTIAPYDAPKGASVALRFTPYRMQGEQIVMQPEYSKVMAELDILQVADIDPAVEKAVEGIMSTLQTFIDDKGF